LTAGSPPLVGFTCRHTPLAMLHAAGMTPFRLLPLTQAPDRAGAWLHDNLCPHVKRVLDRALDGDLPPLAGVVLMASCDAMRRLADAWGTARPDDRVAVLDLPMVDNPRSVAWLTAELERFRTELERWTGRTVTDAAIRSAAADLATLATRLDELAAAAAAGTLPGGWGALQAARNLTVTAPLDESGRHLQQLAGSITRGKDPDCPASLPVLLVGNLLPDPTALSLLEACGARPLADDLCTGARQLVAVTLDDVPDGQVTLRLAEALLAPPHCARTLCPGEPGRWARELATRARASNAAGVIAHVAKFCDPYLARLPALRLELREAGLPLLVLEGDCTSGSVGQHRTRIEAFVEMLAEGT